MNKYIFLFFFLVIPVAAQEEINHPELEWFTIETSHFKVHFHTGTERTARTVAKIAEEVYGPITQFYQHEPDQKVNLIIKDYDDYSNGGAYFFDNKIEFWAPALEFDLRGTHNWLRNVVAHEFTHVVQIQTSLKFGRRIPAIYLQVLNYERERRPDVLYGFPNVIASYPISGFVVPGWFAEGVAQYSRPELEYDYWDSHRDMILRMYALENKMLSWNEMAVFGKNSLGNESVYNSGFSFVTYIGQTYGNDKLLEISKNIQQLDALSIDGAIERALHKPALQIYNEWRETLTHSYQEKTEKIRSSLVEGSIIDSVGFANLSPAFSPDGSTIAYLSNKKGDYFSLAQIFLYNCKTKTDRELSIQTTSQLSWSKDGTKLYYACLSRDNSFYANLSDLYEYNIASEKERRITKGARLGSPDISPDGKTLAAIFGKDGTQNISLVDAVSGKAELITSYAHGEQISGPRWSPDGKEIAFALGINDRQSIWTIDIQSRELKPLVQGYFDARTPVYSTDGSHIIFSCDSTGIFNLYEIDTKGKSLRQLTNVVGGAFMPSIDSLGNLAYSSYQSSGFKLAYLPRTEAVSAQPIQSINYDHRLPYYTKDILLASLTHGSDPPPFPWKQLREFDDTQLPDADIKPYKNTFSSTMFFPYLRVDNYNKSNTGIDALKPGIYIYSSEILDKLSLFGTAAVNDRLDRDLYLGFEFRGKIPLFYQLGLAPTATIEAFNITRKTSAQIELGLDEVPVDVVYNLTEFDISFTQPVFSELSTLKFNFRHSRYSTDMGDIIDSGYNTIPGSSSYYYIGNGLSLEWKYNGIVPSKTSGIRPVGTNIRLNYEYEFNEFNSTGNYEISSDGFVTPIFDHYKFHRAEVEIQHNMELPGWRHTLSFGLHAGKIFGPPVPDFFDYYAGGLIGMRGYSMYALGGNSIAALNATYRFPISEALDTRFLQIYFDKLFAGIFFDAGDAWNEGRPVLKDFKKDIGAELRLQSYSFYALPTCLVISGAYGLDKFVGSDALSTGTQVSYGHEWRFYLTLLFDFEI